MKQKLCLVLVLLVMTCLFAGGKTRRQQQFEVKDADGNIFVLQKDIQTVFDLLGEPLKKENLWAIYPKAGCGFYKIDYENISFLYYDNDNKIVRIVIENDACKIVDNDITVGSSYEEIINAYGVPERETAYFNENNSRNEMQLLYTTQGTEFSYVVHGDEYYSYIIINIDAETKKCNELFVGWNTPC